MHVPIDSMSEAFGQTYIEALASRVPSIFTLSGIACEFAKDRVNCLVVPYKDSDSIQLALESIFSSSFKYLRNLAIYTSILLPLK